MRFAILAVYDSKAEAFMRPMFVSTLGQGVRAFTDEVNRSAQDNMLHTHPEDFILHNLGSWDDNTGLFDIIEPAPVVHASTVRTSP